MSILNFSFKAIDITDAPRLARLLNQMIAQLGTILGPLKKRVEVVYEFTTAAVITDTKWPEIGVQDMRPSGLIITSFYRPSSPGAPPHTAQPGFDWEVTPKGLIAPYGGFGWLASTRYKCLLEIVGNG